jgi:hypothetical protein
MSCEPAKPFLCTPLVPPLNTLVCASACAPLWPPIYVSLARAPPLVTLHGVLDGSPRPEKVRETAQTCTNLGSGLENRRRDTGDQVGEGNDPGEAGNKAVPPLDVAALERVWSLARTWEPALGE